MAFPILLALLLGIKHSFDADHLVAVSSYLARENTPSTALKVGFSWALGHMLTAGLVTYLLFTFKDIFLHRYLESFELLVGIMLVGIGFLAFRDLRRLRRIHLHPHAHGREKHTHPHLHQEKKHFHPHTFGIGVIHGLASNDELLILLTISIGFSSLAELFLGVVLFSLGVVAGMALFSLLISFPVKTWGSRIRTGIMAGSGLLSIGYGLLLLAGIV